jgi:hypothetical protein
VFKCPAGPPPFPPGGDRVVEAPIGRLGYRIGSYLTVEGIRADGPKTGVHTLLVDKIGDYKLREVIGIWIENTELRTGGRCFVKGYESGGWIGVPPEVERATGLQAQAAWQFYFTFLTTQFEHYTQAFISKVSDRDKEQLRALYSTVAAGKGVEATCPHCSSKLRITTAPANYEVICPGGCFRFFGKGVPANVPMVRGQTNVIEEKLEP